MKAPVFYRNIDARDHLELFLVSAVSSLLLVRFYLYLTDYPQIGSGSFHIAHMLYGGLFMMAAIIIGVSFIGRRIQRMTALIGGVGFGVFIDELGKFITRDHNYFFQPTIGIIYAIFISLYLLFNFITRATKLSSTEYQLNALRHFEEAVRHEMDPHEKRRIQKLLNRADQKSVITQELKTLLAQLETVPPPLPRRFYKTLARANRQYRKFWKLRSSNQMIATLFIFQALLFLVVILGTIVNNFDTVNDFFNSYNDYGKELIIGQFLASTVAAIFVINGAIKLRHSRLNAFENFRRATLVNLFLTEFFIFSRIQFDAIPGFAVNLILLMALHYAIDQERHGQPV
jgi:hypothetical protein